MRGDREARREALLAAGARAAAAKGRARREPSPYTLREVREAVDDLEVERRVYEDGDAARE